MDHVSQLPDSLIHHILSFLPAKYVTRTSILSKAWNHLWLTYPVVDFSSVCTLDIFENCLKLHNQEASLAEERFLILLDGSLQRRFEQSHGICKFRMHISFFNCLESLALSLDRWIRSVVDKNVQELDLKACTVNNSCYYVVPQELFSAKSLKMLKLSRCTLGSAEVNTRVELIQLHRLCLDSMIVDNDMFQNFISNCPSIESLVLKYCKGLKSLRLISSLRRLKYAEIYMCDDVQSVDVEAPYVETFTGTLSYEINFVSSTALKKLRLIVQRMGDEQLQALMSQASNLEDLELYHFYLKEFHIKSPSLQRLKLLYSRSSSVVVETPNLTSMEYSSFTIPQTVLIHSSKLLNVYMKLWLHLDEPRNLHRVAKLASVLMKSSLSRRFKLKFNQDNKMMIHDNMNEAFLTSSCDLEDFKQALNVTISSMDSIVFADYVIQKFYPKTLSVACYSSKPIKFLSEDMVQTEGCVDRCRSSAKLWIYKLIFKLKTLSNKWLNRSSPVDALPFS